MLMLEILGVWAIAGAALYGLRRGSRSRQGAVPRMIVRPEEQGR